MRGGLSNTPLAVYTSAAAASACQLRESCVGDTFCAAHASPSLTPTFTLHLLPCPSSETCLCPVPCPSSEACLYLVSCPRPRSVFVLSLSPIFYTRPQHPRPSLQKSTATAGVEGSSVDLRDVILSRVLQGFFHIHFMCSSGK